jgi:hypothetical protein
LTLGPGVSTMLFPQVVIAFLMTLTFLF